jgi:hypothetical protein
VLIKSRPAGPISRLRDHAAVTHLDDMIEAEALLQLLDLHSQGLGLAGVAFKDLDGNRHPSGARSKP